MYWEADPLHMLLLTVIFTYSGNIKNNTHCFKMDSKSADADGKAKINFDIE